MRTIVCDAGPIIHLYEAYCLQLLRQTGNLYLPQRVFNEVQTTLQMEELWPEWLQVISLFPHEQKEAGMWKEAGDLHAGEGTWKQLYPQNECNGMSNVGLTGTTLNYTMTTGSDCNCTSLAGTIVDTLVAGTMEPLGNGDINYDGQVNLHDAVLALQVITGFSPQEVVHKKADSSGSQKIGLSGVIYILQKEAGLR